MKIKYWWGVGPLTFLAMVGCTQVDVGSGVKVCTGADGTTECSEGHDESDNSDNSDNSAG